MKLINREFDANKILLAQSNQYQERLYLEDTVPAGQGKTAKVSIGSLGHFLCLWMTVSYSTLKIKAGFAVEDSGVNYLSTKLSDGNGNRLLFNDFIPLDLISTPGRTKTELSFVQLPFSMAALDAGGASNNLFIPLEFEYLFQANSEIITETRNISDFQNRYRICFHGIRLRTKAGGRQ